MLLQTFIASLFALLPRHIIRFGDVHNDQIYVTNGTYQAPLKGCDIPLEEIFPQSYFVHLAPGHSLEQHSTAIIRDIQPHILYILDFYKEQIVYVGRGIDEELLAAIRTDPGVNVV
jgi:hypothetical protein